jgi:hypothetical protein
MANWLIQAFLNQATTQGSRSTVLRPLGWLIGICIAGVLGAVRFQAPSWIVWLLGVSIGLGVLLYIATFVFCLLTKKEDLLRSETYSIQKLAIEKGFVGDSMSGLFQEERIGQDLVVSGNQIAEEREK